MNAKPLVLVLAVLGLAVAAWFAWGASGDQPTRPTPQPVHDGNDAQVTGQPVVDRAGVDPSGATNAVAAGNDPAQRTAAATGMPDVADDKVTFRGRLVDADGAVMPDIEMGCGVWKNPDGFDFVVDTERNTATRELATREDGRFEVHLARGESGRLTLPSTELVFANQLPPLHSHQGPRDLGDVIVHRSAIVVGVVKDERGAPVDGVNVSAVVDSLALGAASSSVTDDDGRFELGKLRAGEWTLRTASAKYLPTSEQLTVATGARIDDVVLVVAPGSAISGQVVDDLGRGVADMSVGAKRSEARGGVDIERFTGDEAAKTDENGFFTLSGIDGETATVRARGPGHASAFAANVPVGTGDLVLAVQRLAVVEGVLRGADGGPLAGSKVKAIPAGNNGMLAAHGIEGILTDRAPVATTAADGAFRIEGVSPGTVTIAANGKGHRPVQHKGVQIAPAQTISGIQLVADRGAVVRFTVTDEEGNAVAGAKVRVEKPRKPEGGMLRMRSRRVEDTEDEGVRVFGDNDALGSAVTNGKGIAIVAGLAAGTVVLHAEHSEYAAAKSVTLPLLQNGSMEAALELRTPGYAELHITAADGTAEASHYRVRGPLGASDSDSKRGKSDAEGKAVVGPLAAGNYTAELMHEPGGTNIGGAMIAFSGDEGAAIRGAEKRFTVKAGDTAIVEIRRPVLTRVFGTVTGVDGPVAGCRVEIERRESGMPAVAGLGGGRSVTTGRDGAYEIDDVEAGGYTLRYGRLEQIVKAEAEVDVPPELPELRRDLVLRTGKVRIQAWSQTADQPIANAEVAIQRAAKPGSEAGERTETRVMMVSISRTGGDSGDSTMMTIGAQRAKSGADGWAEIEDVPVGNYDVRITHEKHVPGERDNIRVNERQTTDLGRVAMGQAGRVRGKVLDKDGNAAGMALVFHRPVGGEESQPSVAMGGSFTIDALPTGRYTLRAQAMGPTGPGTRGPDVEVEVKAGETTTTDLPLSGK